MNKVAVSGGAESPVRRVAIDLLTSGTFESFDIGTRSRIIFLNAVHVVGMVMLSVFSGVAFVSSNRLLGWATFAAFLLLVATFLFIRVSKRFRVGNYLATSVIFLLYAYLLFSGGEQGSGVLWVLTFPLIALFLHGIPAGTVWSAAFMTLIGFDVFLPSVSGFEFSVLYGIRVVGGFFFTYMFALTYEIVRSATQRTLELTNDELGRATEALRREKLEMDGIFKTVKEGIFLLNGELAILPSYSLFLESVFESANLAGRRFTELLADRIEEREREAVADYLPMLFDGKVHAELLREINPLVRSRFVFRTEEGGSIEKTLSFTFDLIEPTPTNRYILGLVEDLTESVELQKKLSAEDERHKRDMERFFQVLNADPGLMTEFLDETDEELSLLDGLLRDRNLSVQDTLRTAYQSVHGIKGNALLLGLEELAGALHSFEDRIKANMTGGESGWNELLDLTFASTAIRSDLGDIKTAIRRIAGFRNEVHETGPAGYGSVERALLRLSSREAERNGKKVKTDIFGSLRQGIPDSIRRGVKDILIQLIRNSLVHGIESPDRRVRAGKDEYGNITVKFERGGSHFIVRYSDDGGGLDFDRIRRTAEENFGLDPGKLDEAALTRLVFRNGFSTSSGTTMSAGRGAGMAFVGKRVRELGGRMSVRNLPGKRFDMKISFPLVAAGSSDAAKESKFSQNTLQ